MFGKNPIGIIQGRLTPSGGRLQCFPHKKWREEFFTAKSLGFDCIELIVERKIGEPNPVWHAEGVDAIIEASKESGVKIFSLCDDQIMDAGLMSESEVVAETCFKTLVRLIRQLGQLGATRLVLPFLEEASLKKNEESFLSIKHLLKKLVSIADEHGLELMLENDLPTDALRDLLSLTGGRVGVCYDTGNRVALGFNPAKEIRELDALVRHVHIKDKDENGNNVMLGKGLVDFESVFSSLKKINYSGPLILETWRSNDDTREGQENLAFVRSCLRG